MGIWSSLRRRVGVKPVRSRRSSKEVARRKAARGRELRIERFEDRLLLSITTTGTETESALLSSATSSVVGSAAPGLVLLSVIPNQGTVIAPDGVLNVAPQELILRFNEGQTIDTGTLGAISLVRAGGDGVLGNGNDVVVSFGYVGRGDVANEIVVRFKETLPDDLYKLTVSGALKTDTGTALNNGLGNTLQFRLDLGAMVTAVVPQPVTRGAGGLTQATNQIEVYFNSDKLDPTSAQNPQFYQLIATSDTAVTGDDRLFTPTNVTYSPSTNKAVLTFAADLSTLVPAGTQSLRLRIGELYQPITTSTLSPSVDVDRTSYATALSLDGTGVGTSTTPQSLVIANQIQQPVAYNMQWPGSINEPGHRSLPAQLDTEIESHYMGGSSDYSGIPTYTYWFPDIYGTDRAGNPVHNVITEAQKQRTREIFELFQNYFGVQFAESPLGGSIGVCTGDLYPMGMVSSPGDILGVGGMGLAVMDGADAAIWGDSEFGGAWFTTAMHEIMHNLGFGHTYDMPSLTIMGEDGNLGSAEGVYPGLEDLDHALRMFRPDSTDIDMYKFTATTSGTLSAETIAQRLSSSSLLNTTITVFQYKNGKYETLSRNDDYFGKDSYLNLKLEAGVTYFIGVTASGNDDYDPTISDSGIGGLSEGIYDLRLNFTPDSIAHLVDTTGTVFDGNSDGTPGGVYDYWFNVQGTTNAQGQTTKTIFVDKIAASGGTGTLAQPYKTISAALAAAQSGDIVRIVGNNYANDDASVPSTLLDNQAYEIGTDPKQSNRALGDGATMELPKGVTVMIDAGAVFKLLNANIDLGSSAIDIDRSGASLQVLGTPQHSVYFTSYYNKSLGKDSNPNATTPISGHWGGLVFRSDLDHAYGRPDKEDQGIFLDYINHAEITYGGGQVTVDSNRDIYNPIHMAETRVTATYNTITHSADAAMSADPNSFEESKFEGNEGTPYTADYDRVGPEIYGNTLLNNSINGLMVRIRTDAGETLTKLTVPARFDDRDIVIVIPENLVVSDNPGGPLLTFGTTQLLQLGTSSMQAVSGSALSVGEHFTVSNGTLIRDFEFNSVTLSVKDGGSFSNGDQLTIYGYTVTGGVPVPVAQVFEFLDGTTALSDLTHVAVRFRANSSASVIAEALAAAIGSDTKFNVAATVVSNEGEPIGSPVRIALRVGELSRTPEFSAVYAANTGVNIVGSKNVTIGRVPVPYTAADSAATVAAAIAQAINDSGMFDAGAAAAVGDVVVITSTAAKPVTLGGVTRSAVRAAARLAVDPGVVVKLGGARIEMCLGAQLIAEGTSINPIIFTSMEDDRFGAGGSFDTTSDAATNLPQAGDWGGLYFGPVSNGSIDHALIAYGGGKSRIEGNVAGVEFNAIEIHQAHVRVTNSTLTDNAAGGADDRNGRGSSAPATIFVRGAQPVIVNNVFQDNAAAAININVNSLGKDRVPDWGRCTGPVDTFDQFPDNYGPLVRLNHLANNGTNGMVVRGEVLSTQSIWDDTDIVHVLLNEVVSTNQHTFGGIRLQSSANESLVVKLSGATAGLTATGTPLEIGDRIGGTVQIIGMPGHPVVMTSLADDTIGAGSTPSGAPQTDTDNVPNSTPQAGSWRSILLEEYSNDRNVAVVNESELAYGSSGDINGTTGTAQSLGQLASDIDAGDENLRLGFEVHGAIGYDNPADKDVYYFRATAGTEIWLNMSLTTFALDTVIELVDANGTVVASSNDKVSEPASQSIQQDPWHGEDFYSYNPLDAGMRVVLPGPTGTVRSYYVRVYSHGNLTRGAYQLQVRLQQTDEIPGSTIQYADIRYATNGIDLRGMPTHSPLLTTTADTGGNDTFATAQNIGNLLASDRNTITVAGHLSSIDDVNWYKFQLSYEDIQMAGSKKSTFPTIFDIDYADGLARPDTVIWVFDDTGKLIYKADDSSVTDDLPDPTAGAGLTDTSRGSVGPNDAYLGPIDLNEAAGKTYYVAITGKHITADALTQSLTRREPVDSITRIAEDHIDSTDGSLIAGQTTASLNLSAVPFNLSDVTMYVSTNNDLFTEDPYTGAYETDVTDINGNYLPDTQGGTDQVTYGDIAMRQDGELYTLTRAGTATNVDKTATAGQYRQLDTGDAKTLVSSQQDGIKTFQLDPADPTGKTIIPLNSGVSFEAMAHSTDIVTSPVYAVGNITVPAGTGIPYTNNLLYKLDISGKAIDSKASDGSDRLGTNIIPVAQLLTGYVLQLPNQATDLVAPFDTAQEILDGNSFTITDDSGRTKTFEFDCGPDVAIDALGPQAVRDGDTITLTDGTGSITYEFNSGPVISVAGAAITEHSTLTVTNSASPPATFVFEFVKTGGATIAGAIPITYSGLEPISAMTNLIVAAINTNTAGTISAASYIDASGRGTAGNGRINLTGGSAVGGSAFGGTTPVLSSSGDTAYNTGRIQIAYKETDSQSVFGGRIVDAVKVAQPTIEPGFADRGTGGQDRLTFYGAVSFDRAVGPVSGLPAFTQRAGSKTGSNLGTPTPAGQIIKFHAGDTFDVLGKQIAKVINATTSGTFTVTADNQGKTIVLSNATATTAQVPIKLAGAGPGGTVTGMAFLNGHLYCVSDKGGLYELVNYDTWGLEPYQTPDPPGGPKSITATDDSATAGAHLVYLTSSKNFVAGISFSGLTAGPKNVEPDSAGKGKYANVLFATDTLGKLYAFDITGAPQAVFLDGSLPDATNRTASIQLKAANGSNLGTLGNPVTGVSFSNIDYNLWHTTTRRGTNTGHGITSTEGLDDSRVSQENFPTKGSTSLYFGLEDPRSGTVVGAAQPGAASYQYHNSGVYQTYDMPGGAHGSLVTNAFSLVGYTAQDCPALYFNYFLDTGTRTWFDTARVFASADNVHWTQLASTDSAAWSGIPQLTINSNGWLQADLNVSGLAGQSNIRLRFDFSTSGEMHIGDSYDLTPVTSGRSGELTTDTGMLGGAYLSGVAGSQLKDNEYLSIANDSGLPNTTPGIRFEFDLGGVLVVPAGVAGSLIPNGEQFTITDKASPANTVTFEFRNNGTLAGGSIVTISLSPTDSPLDVAGKIVTAVNDTVASGKLKLITAMSSANRVEIVNAVAVGVALDAAVTLEGNGPGTTTVPPPVIVTVDFSMTAAQVAKQVADAMNATFYTGPAGKTGDSVKIDSRIPELLHMIAHRVNQQATGYGPLPYSNSLSGDHPTKTPNYNPPINDRFHNFATGQDNRHEGFYVDDIIVGFVEARRDGYCGAVELDDLLKDFSRAQGPYRVGGLPPGDSPSAGLR